MGEAGAGFPCFLSAGMTRLCRSPEGLGHVSVGSSEGRLGCCRSQLWDQLPRELDEGPSFYTCPQMWLIPCSIHFLSMSPWP